MDQLEFPIDEFDIKTQKEESRNIFFSVLACQPNIHLKILKFILIDDIDF